MSVVIKLRNVRMMYPHLASVDKTGKYSVGVLVEKNSEMYRTLMAKLREAWSEGADRYGKAQFEPNPTDSRILRASYMRIGGTEDAKGRPMPAWMDGYICFGATSHDPRPVVDGNLEPVNAGDSNVCYSGQLCNVSLDLAAYPKAESYDSGIGRYLRSVVVLGNGERIVTQSGGFTDIVDEWSDME